jgi:hypothetical protein
MEEQELEKTQQPQLIVTEDMRSYIYDMAKWANFLGIVGCIFAVIMFMAALTLGPAMNANPELAKMLGQLGTMDSTTISIVFLFYGLLIFYPSFLMLRYANKAKNGVLYGEQANLDEAMSKLKSLFKYYGILTIIFIAMYVMMFFSKVAGVA